MEMTLREKMLNFRAKYKMSQERMAKECGVAVLTINAVENEKPTVRELTKLKVELFMKEYENEIINKQNQDL